MLAPRGTEPRCAVTSAHQAMLIDFSLYDVKCVRLDEQTLTQVFADLIGWGMVEPRRIELLTS